MLGTNRTASIYTRSGGQWVDSGTTWKCRLQPISPTVSISAARYMESTHMAVGNPTPIISEGTKLVIDGGAYYVAGSQMHNKPGTGAHHQEVWLTRSEA